MRGTLSQGERLDSARQAVDNQQRICRIWRERKQVKVSCHKPGEERGQPMLV